MKKLNWFLSIFVVVGFLLVQVQPGWTSPISETEPNDSFATAQSLAASFSTESNPDIYDSTVVPHVSVVAGIGPPSYPNDVDYYSFTVEEAGQTGYFDIDYGWTGEYPPDDVDTVLSLFDSAFNLLAFSDDSIDTDPGSEYGRDSFIGKYTFLAPGIYYIAVASWGNMPDPLGIYAGPLYRPDDVVAGEKYEGNSGPSEVTVGWGTTAGDYTLHVSLSEATPTLPEPLIVPVDIEPGSCSNLLNTKRKTVFTVAILGTEDLSVYDIDESSITLEGVRPIRSHYEDVATPFEPGMEKLSTFDCPDEGPDGYLDLVMKFKTRKVLEAIADSMGSDVEHRQVVWLVLQGNLLDGTPIEGEDAVIILRKGKRRK